MAIFKICVRKQRKDGFYPVYIRVIQCRTIAYIKTDKAVTDKYVSNTDVSDPYVIRLLSARIVEYMERINRLSNTGNWKASDIVEYLKHGDEELCFSDYARKYHDRMYDRGEHRNARNYELAYQHLERYAGTNRIMFSMLTSPFVNGWFKTLEHTHRAKEMYPVCIRQIFKEAIKEFNDYDSEIIRINTNPWINVKIPKSDRAEQLAITPEACRDFFPTYSRKHTEVATGRTWIRRCPACVMIRLNEKCGLIPTYARKTIKAGSLVTTCQDQKVSCLYVVKESTLVQV